MVKINRINWRGCALIFVLTRNQTKMDDMIKDMEKLKLSARYRIMKREEKNAIAMELLESSSNGKLKHGALKETSEKWCCSVDTIYRVWKRCVQQRANAPLRGVSFATDEGHSGRKGPTAAFVTELYAKIAKLKPEERGDLRSLSAALGVPITTLQRYVKSKLLRVHTITLKPTLSEDHKRQRVEFIASLLVHHDCGPTFSAMYDRVHLDEKWFFLKKTKRRVYLTPAEPDPYHHTQHKSHVPKIMFLCAVARPRVHPVTGEVFDGRIGMWPFADWVPAQRGSRNRQAGTLVLKSRPANRDTYKQLLMEEVLPAVKSKWPHWSEKHVILQHDNATPHRSMVDDAFVRAATEGEWRVSLEFQPPQSPDLNVLDLGFFYSIQSLQFKQPAASLEDLLRSVSFAFESLSFETLDNTFLTLQQVMGSILRVGGGNNYKLPRMGKDRMRRVGVLPTVIDVDIDLYDALTSQCQQTMI